MADVSDNEEIIATRKLHGLDYDLFKDEKEIEVGEYVRTDKGEIAKVTSVAKETLGETLGANEYRSIGFCNTEPYVYGNIVKHSKQLIDLIEVGDIVNGMKVLDIKKIVKDIEPFKTIYSKEKISICVFISEAGAYYIDVKDTDIKTILTKESYIANCYKVRGRE